MKYNKLHPPRELSDEFLEVLSETLAQYPDGVSEHTLLRQLSDVYFSFLGDSPWLPHALFCAHFLLFHALYQLRDRAWQAQRAHLEIASMRIRWLPYQGQASALTLPDSLRDYYLDLSNLESTSERDVDELLAAFWVRFQSMDERAGALQELGLADPVDDATIKRSYRQLAMQHHPDRGGDTERLQAINAAVNVLLKKV